MWEQVEALCQEGRTADPASKEFDGMAKVRGAGRDRGRSGERGRVRWMERGASSGQVEAVGAERAWNERRGWRRG